MQNFKYIIITLSKFSSSQTTMFCPTVRPNLKEFENFHEFVQNLDRTYKKDYGMVKVVPPPEWKPRKSPYEKALDNLTINGPIEQNIFGKGGIYQCLHIAKKSMSYQEYKAKALELDKITDQLSGEEVEQLFWKNIAFSPPLYGADLLNSLMQPCSGGWDLKNLKSVLTHCIFDKIKGVNTPYCYVGSWKALFCWHKEDLDLSAINYVHKGKNKFWYAIRNDMGNYLQKQAQRYFPEHFSKCSQYLRHKTTIINPYILKRKYPELVIHKVEQHQNQFVLVFGGAYHTGFNFGFNLAEAVNYASLDWLRQVSLSKSCQCSRSSVKASVVEIYKNLMKSPLKDTQQFAKLQQFIVDTVSVNSSEEQEEEDEKTKKAVKKAFKKKLRNDKKAPKKIKFENEEFIVDNWIECEKCKTWRIISKNPRKYPYFTCKSINKKCKSKQVVPKNAFTIN